MEILNLTQEELTEKSISAMFDSVNLILELNSKAELTEEETDTKLRNQEHLEIMLSKEDILLNLTKTKKEEIKSVL